jgi:hypothetical protein
MFLTFLLTRQVARAERAGAQGPPRAHHRRLLRHRRGVCGAVRVAGRQGDSGGAPWGRAARGQDTRGGGGHACRCVRPHGGAAVWCSGWGFMATSFDRGFRLHVHAQPPGWNEHTANERRRSEVEVGCALSSSMADGLSARNHHQDEGVLCYKERLFSDPGFVSLTCLDMREIRQTWGRW